MKKLSKIDESTWGGILDRGRGDTIRKEDDINLYDGQEMVDYILNHYETIGQKEDELPIYNKSTESIIVPVILYTDNNLSDNIINRIFYRREEKCVYITTHFYKNTLEKIKSNPKFKTSMYFNDYYSIYPKKGDINNKFFIELIDFILNNIDRNAIPIMRKKDINESVWGGILDRGAGDAIRKEDLPEQNKEQWWRNIELPNAPKYKKDELRALDLMYDFAVDKINKKFNVLWPYQIVFHFDGEPYWDLTIEHTTPRGYDTFTMYAHGPRAPWQIYFSDMSMGEKRSIRYRLEKKKFYVYPYKYGDGRVEYHLREQSTYNNEKGIELK